MHLLDQWAHQNCSCRYYICINALLVCETDSFCVLRDLWLLSKSAFKEKTMDVHTRLMQTYTKVPEWWFLCVLFVNIVGTLLLCQYNNDQLQLPWWGVLLACALAFIFTLPVGVIAATTNQVRLHTFS